MLTRWDPFTEMSRFQDELFRSALARNGEHRVFAPAVDVYEDGDAVFVQAELPGLKLEDITVNVENDVLTLTGERKSERDEGHHVRERWHGAFARSFKLPRTIDVEKISATLKDGVLTVQLPKRESIKPRKIEVKS